MSNTILKSNNIALKCFRHYDEGFSGFSSIIAPERGFKRGSVNQQEAEDNAGGAEECLLCNPEKLLRHPVINFHLDENVMSFENASPFLEADHQVYALWHKDQQKRYCGAHRFKLTDYKEMDFYYPALAAIARAKTFPNTEEGQHLQEGTLPVRPILGVNIGKLAGQSIPHFHTQAGWQSCSTHMPNGKSRQLYYEELRENGLMLYENDELVLFAPWCQLGRYHLQLHLKHKYYLQEVTRQELSLMSVIAVQLIQKFLQVGIENINFALSASPLGFRWSPVIFDILPRVNVPAFYELCFGSSVVDCAPQEAIGFYHSGRDWRDIFLEAQGFDAAKQYQQMFGD